MGLHGVLEVEVVSGENLADRDNFLFHVVRGNWSDVWVSVCLGETPILTTGVRKNVIDTVFGEHVTLPVCEAADYLNITVWDKDGLRSELVGETRMHLGNPDKEWQKEASVHLRGDAGLINMKVRYTPAAQARKESIEVPRSYFPMHTGGTMTFYQDAHTDKIPGITGNVDGAFEAMADAINNAKKLIYIAGWSLFTGTRLHRNGKKLGELLKKRAGDGVRVLILIWNEKFSAGLCAGLVGTYDEDTDRYFHKSGVYVGKVRREIDLNCKIKEKIAETIWAHHQKLLVADDGEGDIVAFLGGLDLTLGRWDTPEHQLFTTLNNEHISDFYNGFVPLNEKYGPREPWHDVHARLTGMAAIDLLRNFEERWRAQVPSKAHLLCQTYDEDLLKVQEGKYNNKNIQWQMQVVRSIDKDSAEFNSGRVCAINLQEGRVIDTSIHQALVRLIRKAEKFIYIESQYFIGSSSAWSEDQNVSAQNIVPLEIAHRVVSKIKAGEPFRVYVVIPMMPEGNVRRPILKASVKAILHFQFLTIQMMYKRIGEALREVGSELHPSDYLVVLCLGKKESRAEVREATKEEPRKGSTEWEWREKSRFLIYVHSKMIIADDSHIIVGSANLNERSLDGARDTEVAVSARQVKVNLIKKEGVPVSDGEVSMFRRRLWAEHTSGLSEKEKLLDPSSLSVMRRIRSLADEALDTYINGKPDEKSMSRFMRYPLDVSKDGEIGPIMGIPTLPDFDIPVEGSRGILPSRAVV